ncbi:MAG: ribbon-helix-helix domain-containing protein [Isosphaeraceae bacterium]
MATMNISLPDSMKAFVETQARKEGFGTVSEYLRSIIREVRSVRLGKPLRRSSRRGLKAAPPPR